MYSRKVLRTYPAFGPAKGHVERHQLISFDEVLLLQLPNERSLSASPHGLLDHEQ